MQKGKHVFYTSALHQSYLALVLEWGNPFNPFPRKALVFFHFQIIFHFFFSLHFYLLGLFDIFTHLTWKNAPYAKKITDGEFRGMGRWTSVGGFSCFVFCFSPVTQVRILRPRLRRLIRIYSENNIFQLEYHQATIRVSIIASAMSHFHSYTHETQYPCIYFSSSFILQITWFLGHDVWPS